MKNNIIEKMHIIEPADKLAKTVGKVLNFKIGNRDATFFTKSTEYGKLIDNDYNSYLQHEQAKRLMSEAFSNSTDITGKNKAAETKKEEDDKDEFQSIIGGGTEYYDMTREQEDAVIEELIRQIEKKDLQREEALKSMSEDVTKSLISDDIIKKYLERRNKAAEAKKAAQDKKEAEAKKEEVIKEAEAKKEEIGKDIIKKLLERRNKAAEAKKAAQDKKEAEAKKEEVIKEAEAKKEKEEEEEEGEDEMLKLARQGKFISNFLDFLDVATKPMIQQQMIMRGIPFNEKQNKRELKRKIKNTPWLDAVEENTIKKRLEEYRTEHGFLPIENVQETAESSKNKPKAEAKSEKETEEKNIQDIEEDINKLEEKDKNINNLYKILSNYPIKELQIFAKNKGIIISTKTKKSEYINLLSASLLSKSETVAPIEELEKRINILNDVDEDLTTLNIKQIKEIAKDLQISKLSKYSKKNINELIDIIKEAQAKIKILTKEKLLKDKDELLKKKPLKFSSTARQRSKSVAPQKI